MYFSGIESINIQIFTNKEAILGPSNLQLRCDYTLGSGESVFTSTIQAKINNEFVNIAYFGIIFGNDPVFLSNGTYLSSRANLSNPTSSLPDTYIVILTFNQIKCEDETEYRCLVSTVTNGVTSQPTSIATGLVVKGKYT